MTYIVEPSLEGEERHVTKPHMKIDPGKKTKKNKQKQQINKHLTEFKSIAIAIHNNGIKMQKMEWHGMTFNNGWQILLSLDSLHAYKRSTQDKLFICVHNSPHRSYEIGISTLESITFTGDERELRE